MDAHARLARLLVTYRARALVAVALAGYFALLAALGGHETGWRRLGVPAQTPRFSDLRNLTSSWECYRRGIAVLPTNPCDFEHRPADFPQIWLLPAHLGLGRGDTFALGLAQGGVFLLAALVVLPAGASLGAGLLYALAVCSPAVMLGLERENPDLVLFPLVLLAVLAASRRGAGEYVSAMLVLLAAVLKFYPVFVLAFLLRRATRTASLAAVAAGAVFGIYLLATVSYVRKLVGAIPPSDIFAYGVRRMSEWFSLAALETIHTLGGYRAWDVGLVLVALAAGWLAGRRLRPALGPRPLDRAAERDLDLFWAGASVYVGSYAIFRSNDYRLVFCLLMVPQLARWVRERHALAFVTAAALLLTMWLGEWTGIEGQWNGMAGVHVPLAWWNRQTALGNASFPLPIVVIAQFVLFAALIGWLFASAPSMIDRLPRRMRAVIVRSR